jgi:hypothetical protein
VAFASCCGSPLTRAAPFFYSRLFDVLQFSPKSFEFFLRASLGISSSSSQAEIGSGFAVTGAVGRKSISTERTFRDLSDPAMLRAKCSDLCHALAADVAEHGLEGRAVGLKLKTVEFQVRMRARACVCVCVRVCVCVCVRARGWVGGLTLIEVLALLCEWLPKKNGLTRTLFTTVFAVTGAQPHVDA